MKGGGNVMRNWTGEEVTAIQKSILASKRWQDFVDKYPKYWSRIDREFRPRRWKRRFRPVPIRFVYILPESRDGTIPYAISYPDEIVMNWYLMDFFRTKRIMRQILTHELVHHWLRLNGWPYLDWDAMFVEALRYLGIDNEYDIVARYRPRRGTGRKWTQ
jgi:hypothetical protein